MEIDDDKIDALILDMWLTNLEITLEEIAENLCLSLKRVKNTLKKYSHLLDIDPKELE